jgi:hypothetical protein
MLTRALRELHQLDDIKSVKKAAGERSNARKVVAKASVAKAKAKELRERTLSRKQKGQRSRHHAAPPASAAPPTPQSPSPRDAQLSWLAASVAAQDAALELVAAPRPLAAPVQLLAAETEPAQMPAAQPEASYRLADAHARPVCSPGLPEDEEDPGRGRTRTRHRKVRHASPPKPSFSPELSVLSQQAQPPLHAWSTSGDAVHAPGEAVLLGDHTESIDI